MDTQRTIDSLKCHYKTVFFQYSNDVRQTNNLSKKKKPSKVLERLVPYLFASRAVTTYKVLANRRSTTDVDVCVRTVVFVTTTRQEKMTCGHLKTESKK